MFFKEKLKDGIRVLGSMPFVSPVVLNSNVRRVLGKLPGSNALYGSGWDRLHPFDREHGTDTSGSLSGEELRASGEHPAFAHVTMYGGSQPSVVREALRQIPHLETCTFIDLGCGKGRPVIVASEFPFRNIVGVELSPELARIARTNAATIAKRYPNRPHIYIENGDATAHPLPSGDIVLFLYHAFGAELVMKVVRSVEAALASERRAIYAVLYNPVNGACFDASPALTRRYARMIPYAAEERGYGPDLSDAVVIWQGGDAPATSARADAKIVITAVNSRAEVVA